MTKQIKSEAQDRNFSISLIHGHKGEIKRSTDFRNLVQFMLTNEKLVEKAAQIAELAKNDYSEYQRVKSTCPGFVIGQFSQRDVKSCLRYEPVIGFDIDHIEDAQQYRQIWEKLTRWPFTFVAFPSLSQKGIRVLVYTDATKEKHKQYYSAIAASLSSLIGFPTKSSIRKSLKGLGLSNEKIEEFLDSAAHIDDVTNDISRFWYYSGITKNQLFVNHKSEVFKLTEYEANPSPPSSAKSKPASLSDYVYTFTDEDKISYLVDKIESARIDITAGVVEWFKVGIALYDALGDYAESYFDRVSQFHPKYSASSCRREWDRVRSKYTPGGVTIATFYRWCADAGINLDFKELKLIHADKFEVDEKSEVYQQVSTAIADTPDLDAVVIATVLKKPDFLDSIPDVAPKFSSECFSTGDAQIVYSAIEILVRDQMSVSPVSVQAKLKYAGQDETILNKFTVVSPSLSDFLTNIRLLYGQFTKRQFIEVAQSAIREVSEPDIDALGYVSEFVDTVDELTDLEVSTTESDGQTLSMEAATAYKKTVDLKRTHGNTITGVPTGLTDLDELTDGFQKSDLIILAARPGMGKTSLGLLFVATAAIDHNLPVALYSLEMPRIQLTNRIASIRAEIPYKKIKKGELTSSELDRYFAALSDIERSRIYIDDKNMATAAYIRSKAKKIKRKEGGLSLILIDYLGLMGAPTYIEKQGGKNAKVGYNSNRLKALAKELDVPVVALSQLSRAVETRGGDKRPQLSDLRDSGEVEQDADMVIFVYRPEYYQIMEDEEGQSLKGIADLIVAKHRHGEVDDLRVGFEGQFTKFWDGVGVCQPPIKESNAELSWPPELPEDGEGKYNPSIAPPPKTNDDDDIPF